MRRYPARPPRRTGKTARALGNRRGRPGRTLGQKSEWNFLYLTGIWPDLAEGRIPSPENLPVGLDGYYRYLLGTRVGSRDWQEWGADLLEVLLALQEPVDLETLSSFLGWEPRPTHQRVGQVAQVLSTALLQEGRYFRHHWSLAGFLRDPQQAGPWWCDLKAGHRRIAGRILAAWGGLEAGLPGLRNLERPDYGLRYVAIHLVEGEAWPQAYRLLTDFDFLEARCRTTSVFDLEADYRLALARWPENDADRRAVLAAFEEPPAPGRLSHRQGARVALPGALQPPHLAGCSRGSLHALCEAAQPKRRSWLRSLQDPARSPRPGCARWKGIRSR